MKPCASLSSLTVLFDLGSFDLYIAAHALVAGQVHHDSLHVKRQAVCICRGMWGSTMNGKTWHQERCGGNWFFGLNFRGLTWLRNAITSIGYVIYVTNRVQTWRSGVYIPGATRFFIFSKMPTMLLNSTKLKLNEYWFSLSLWKSVGSLYLAAYLRLLPRLKLNGVTFLPICKSS
jgi:hypothetical protein